jgi:hypothetical protein
MNIDVAPTFTDLGTGQVPDDMDGRSFAGFFTNGTQQTILVDNLTPF